MATKSESRDGSAARPRPTGAGWSTSFRGPARRGSTAALAVSLAIVGLSQAAAGCRCEEQPARSNNPQDRRRVQEQLQAFTERVRRVRDAVPAGEAAQETPCPDEELQAALDGGYGRMLLVDYDQLERYQRPELDPYAEERKPWELLTAPEFRTIDPPQSGDDLRKLTDTLYRIRNLQEKWRYWAVVRSSLKTLPREESGKFHAGAYEGVLVVVDTKTAQALCQASVSARSSEEVAGYESTARSAVLFKDFRRHLERSLNSAAERITRRLELTF